MKIKVASASFSKNLILQQELLAQFPHSQFNASNQILSGSALIQFLLDADAAIIGQDRVDRFVMESLPSLHTFAKYGVGLDNIDLESAKLLGKRVLWTPGINKRAVAEHTLGLILSLLRNIVLSHTLLRQGIWQKNGGLSLTGKSVGIVGCGHIGLELMLLLQPFGCSFWIVDLEDKREQLQPYLAQQVSLETMLPQVDILSLHVPLTRSTYRLLTQKQFQQMKPSAIVINTSRGAVIDLPDLKQALQHGTIAGAALDVFPEEPLHDQELTQKPNVVLTPHIAGNSQEAILAMGRSAIQHLWNACL